MKDERNIPGAWEKDHDKDAVMGFIANIFDPLDGRFSWKDHLPGPYDSVWAWKVSDEIVSALVTRPIETVGGAHGVAIGMVVTSPESRSKGFAAALVDAVVGYRESKGNTFAVLWAQDCLIPFYAKLGFKETQAEDDYVVAPAPDESAPRSDITFHDFNELSHQGFDALRLAYHRRNKKGTGTILRHFQGNTWHGISGSRDGQLGILFGASEKRPDFYAVVAHGERRPVILEFTGKPLDFKNAVSWIVTQLGTESVSYSLTDPLHERHVQTVQVISQKTNFHTLVRSRVGIQPETPIMTWLDRI